MIEGGHEDVRDFGPLLDQTHLFSRIGHNTPILPCGQGRKQKARKEREGGTGFLYSPPPPSSSRATTDRQTTAPLDDIFERFIDDGWNDKETLSFRAVMRQLLINTRVGEEIH